MTCRAQASAHQLPFRASLPSPKGIGPACPSSAWTVGRELRRADRGAKHSRQASKGGRRVQEAIGLGLDPLEHSLFARFNTPFDAAPPLPGRDRSRSRYTREHLCPPVAHLTMAALTSGPDRRLTGFYGAIVGSASTFSLRASQRYQPRAVHRSSCPPGFESRVPIHVRPPLLTSTLCPDHGTSERSCTHPACAACSPSTSASHPHRLSPDGPASAP